SLVSDWSSDVCSSDLLLVFNSWDLKDSNNTMYDLDEGGRVTRWYVVRDLGAALGETGRLAPKRNNIDEFEHETFITGVRDNFVRSEERRVGRGARYCG